MLQDIFYKLCRYYGVEPDRKGWAHITCPGCRREADEKHTHFSFNDAIGHGFCCNITIGISKLWQKVSGENIRYDAAPKPVKVKVDAPWQARSIELLNTYFKHLKSADMWRKYKPVNEETIAKFKLGYGTLPGDNINRLIVPQFEGDKIVSFHGRATIDHPIKWRTVQGGIKAAFGIHRVKPGKGVVVCENYVDGMLLEQEGDGRFVAVSMGSARAFSFEELKALLARRPELVIVGFDNDLAGQPNEKIVGSLRGEWRCKWADKHPGEEIPEVPEPRNGVKLANMLLDAKQSTHLFQWPDYAPAKADMGWLVEQGGF